MAWVVALSRADEGDLGGSLHQAISHIENGY